MYFAKVSEILLLLSDKVSWKCSWCEMFSPGCAVAAEKDFVGASLVSVLHTLLVDERSAPEIKYNSMVLLCSLMSSG